MNRTQLLASPLHGTPDVASLERVERSLDAVSLADLLRNGFVYPPFSIYEDVRVASCGFNPGQDLFDAPTYRPSFRDVHPTRTDTAAPGDWVDEYHRRLCAALSESTRDMAAPWLLQSGGKDSTSLAIAVADARPDTTCVTYLGGQEEDEVGSARQVATRLGLRHVALTCDAGRAYDRYLALLPGIRLLTADFALLSYVDLATEIAGNGGDGILDGLGSDAYLGVPVHWPKRMLRAFARNLQLPHFVQESRWLSHSFRLNYLLATLQMDPFERGFPGSRFTDTEVDALLGQPIAQRSRARLSRFLPALADANAMQQQSITLDIMSSAGGFAKGVYTAPALSLSVRYPYCDRALREWLSRDVPPELRMDTRKGINKVLVRAHIGRRFADLPYVRTKGSFRFDLRELSRRRFDHVLACAERMRDVLPGAPRWLQAHRHRVDNKYDASKFYLLAVVLPWLEVHASRPGTQPAPRTHERDEAFHATAAAMQATLGTPATAMAATSPHPLRCG